MLSQSFGASLSQPRHLRLMFGSINAQGRSATISVTERHGPDTTQITAFLQTSFQFGGRVKGKTYALTGLIAAVLRALPGSVSIT